VNDLFAQPAVADVSLPAITAIAPWFGGKRTLAPRIVSLMRPHRCYWEPFVGGISVVLVKPPAPMETINDLNGEITNLARVLASPACADLYGRLQRTVMSEQLHAEAAQRWKDRGITPAPDVPDLERAYDYFLCAWLGRNGVAGTSSYNNGFCVRYTANGGHAAKRFRSAVESIFDWHERLRNVTILNRDGFELLDRIEDEPKTVIYLDPPYVEKGAKYVHDFAPEDHRRLRESVERFGKAQVIVSYYDHPKVRELYAGWRFIDCTMTKSLVSAGMRAKGGTTVAPEVLIVNEGGGA
jgi:DNA adenine methylase